MNHFLIPTQKTLIDAKEDVFIDIFKVATNDSSNFFKKRK
jgi:hypothetical protein